MTNQKIGLQIWPQILSTIKMLIGIPIYFLGAAGYWIAFVSVSLFNIWLDKADGDLARWIKKHFKIPLWPRGERYNGNTDIWQAGFLLPLFGWRYIIFPGVFMLIGLALSSKRGPAGALGRLILVLNSLVSMTVAFCMAGDKVTGDWWISAPIVLVGLLMLYLTWGSWVKNIRGEL